MHCQWKQSLIKITMDMFIAAKKNDLELLKKCIDEEKTDINYSNSKNKRVGHYAIKHNNLVMLQWLVEHGYQISSKIDYMGYAIENEEYQIALEKGFFEIFKWLHKKFGFYEMRKYGPNNPENITYYAVKENDLETLKWMIQKGYPADHEEYQLALEEGFFEIFKWLHEHVKECNSDQVTKYMIYEDQWFNWAIENKFKVNKQAMIHTALTGKLDLLQKLYQYHPKLNMDICVAACESGNLEMLKWCFETDQIKFKNESDKYELAYAAVKSGSLTLLKWLYKCNIKLDTESKSEIHNYKNACLKASKNGHYQILKWLIKHYHLLISNYPKIIKRIIENQLPEDSNLEILQWLHPYVVSDNHDVELGYGIITYVMKLYKCKKGNKITKTVCTIAAKNKKFKILKWLVENGYTYDDLSYVVYELYQKSI